MPPRGAGPWPGAPHRRTGTSGGDGQDSGAGPGGGRLYLARYLARGRGRRIGAQSRGRGWQLGGLNSNPGPVRNPGGGGTGGREAVTARAAGLWAELSAGVSRAAVLWVELSAGGPHPWRLNRRGALYRRNSGVHVRGRRDPGRVDPGRGWTWTTAGSVRESD